MRRISSFLFLFVFVVLATAVFSETPGFQTAVYSQPSIPANAIRLDLEPIEGFGPTAVDDLVTGNSCTDSTDIPVSESGGGGTVYVNGLTTDASDPNLSSCTWGTPASNQGYRSAWYQFTTEYAGNVTITTRGSTNYDTVLSVFSGSCGALQTVSCNDDYWGFSSEVTFPVHDHATYYLEITDWKLGYIDLPYLQISAWLNPVESEWESMNPIPEQVSRHATAVAGNSIYIIGGETTIAPGVSEKMYRLDTQTGGWTQMPNMLGGYANTTAAYVDGKIYVPGGYNGGGIDNTHRAYNIPTASFPNGYWETDPMSPPPGPAYAWSQAVAIDNGYYLTGGSDYTGNTLPPDVITPTINVSDRLLRYYPSSNGWVTISAHPMQAPRFAHTAGNVGGLICVAGGLQISGGGASYLVTNSECYSSINSSWTPLVEMNEPRFAAASAVGADGKWYVFGGLTVDDGTVVAAISTEVYNPATNQWTTLPPQYNLGPPQYTLGNAIYDGNNPNRTWAAGGAVGDYIWAIGGNLPVNDPTVALTNRLKTYQQYNLLTYLPIVFSPQSTSHSGSLATAEALYLNSPRWDSFGEQEYYDAYFFDVTGPYQTTTIEMSDIANGNDYNLFLYTDNKLLIGSSDKPGASVERIEIPLGAGRYYVMVERYSQIYENESYRLIVQR